MPLIQSSADNLQFIDPPPSSSSLASARALITASLDPASAQTPHPSLLPTENPPATLSQSAAPPTAAHAIDLSRYEEPSAPTTTSDLAAWKQALERSYASSEYLSARLTNLGLLETYGKNAWLIGNAQLEDVLRELEAEVEAAKAELEDLERQRRERQGAVAGEIKALEESWRKGVGRCIEVQAASEGVRREILEARKRGAT